MVIFASEKSTEEVHTKLTATDGSKLFSNFSHSSDSCSLGCSALDMWSNVQGKTEDQEGSVSLSLPTLQVTVV